MKKLHKTGIAIISALAPAAALGVVGGVIINSLPKKDKSITKEAWFEEYDKVSAIHQNSFEFYAIDDIKINVNGENRNITEIQDKFDTDESILVREAYVYFEPKLEEVETWRNISGPTSKKLRAKADAATSCKYAMDDETLSIEITSTDGSVTKYVFNRFGYILSYDFKDTKSGDENNYIVTYEGEPRIISQYDVPYDEDIGYHYGQYLQLYKSTKYTFTINVKSNIKEIYITDDNANWLDFTNGLSISHEGRELVKDTDWTWENGNYINLTNVISSGTLVITFTVPSDVTTWRSVYMVATNW